MSPHSFLSTCDGRFKTLTLYLFAKRNVCVCWSERWLLTCWIDWCSWFTTYQSALGTKLMFSVCNRTQSCAILVGKIYIYSTHRNYMLKGVFSTCSSKYVCDWIQTISVFFNRPWLDFPKQMKNFCSLYRRFCLISTACFPKVLFSKLFLKRFVN